MPQMGLKLLQEEQLQKQLKQLVIWFVITSLIKCTKTSKTAQQNNLETITNEKQVSEFIMSMMKDHY